MADEKVLGLEVPTKVINSYKELTKEIKHAQSAQVDALKTFGDSSEQYKKASQNVAKLKDQMDDLNDSTNSLKGSGIERSAQGFSALAEGLRNLDFDKVKVGLTAIKSALAATGIMLIVQGVMYLIENFEELSKGSGILAKSLRFVGDILGVVKDALYAVTDVLGLTNSELDKQGEAIVENAKKTNEALNQQTKDFDRQMAVAKAAGKSTIELEQAKQQAIIDTNVQIVKQIEAFVRAGGVMDEEQTKQLTASLEVIKDARTQQKVAEITHNKEVTDNYKSALAERKKALDEETKHKEELLKQESDAMDTLFQKQEEIRQKDLEAEEAYKAEQDRLNELNHQNDLARIEKNKNDAIAASKLKSEQEKAAVNETLAVSALASKNQADMVNFLFDLKRSKLKKGSEEELKAAKRQFQLNKTIAIQSSIISGIQGVINALSAQSVIPEPYGTILKVANAVGVGIATTINTAKIAAQQFNEGGAGGGGDSSASVGGVGSTATAAPPTIATPQNTPPSTTAFDDTGKNLTPTLKVINVETESKAVSNRVTKLENQATF